LNGGEVIHGERGYIYGWRLVSVEKRNRVRENIVTWMWGHVADRT